MTLSPTCWACGLAPDAPVQKHILDGFEPTRYPPAQIKALPLADIIAPDPGEDTPLAQLPIACVSCGNVMGTAHKCPTCGAVHAPVVSRPEPVAADAPRPCPYCGVPNPIDRSICLNCAGLLAGDENAV